MTFIFTLWSEIEFGLPARSLLGGSAEEWMPFGLVPFHPKTMLILASLSSHFGFSSVSGRTFCLLVLSLEIGFNTDPAPGFCYPSLDTRWFLFNAEFFSTLRNVLIFRRKSTQRGILVK